MSPTVCVAPDDERRPATILGAAQSAHAAGLCVLPVACDGSKRPFLQSWQQYQHARPTVAERRQWFEADGVAGLGIVCGQISGGLEMLEFEGCAVSDGVFDAFLESAGACGLGGLVGRIRIGYEERTPAGGLHWLYRCPEAVDGNLKLARRPGTTPGVVDVLIETRGEGGFVVVAPSHGATHPTGRPWTALAGGFATIVSVTADERRALLDLARTFDAMPSRVTAEPTDRPAPSVAPDGAPGGADSGLSPVDDFNRRADWASILGGWTHLYDRGGAGYWRRPGKSDGVSATTNHLGTVRLKVFSTSTPFDNGDGVTYSKYGAWCVLNGYDPDSQSDRSAAARALVALGYGRRHAPTEYGPGLGLESDKVVAGAQAIVAESRKETATPVIPAAWWDWHLPRRPWLQGVIDMADAREMANADALLITTITRIVPAVDWRIRTPNVGQGVGTLNLHTYTAAASGGGKGAGNSGARALVPEDVNQYAPVRGGVSFIEVGPGSGEGITKAYWGEITDPETGKPVPAQTEHHVLFIDEEGGSIEQLSSRSGSTLSENFRKTFVAEGIRPSVRLHSERLQPFGYRMAFLMNAQVHLAGFIFEDRSARGGTLQRVLWAAASDLKPLPDDGELPELLPEPGPLNLPIPSVSDADAPERIDGFTVMTADKAVSDAYRRRMRHRDEWTSHEPYIVLKLASLFALIAGRWHVNLDDWGMASGVVEYSAAVRGWVYEQVRADSGRKAQAANRAHIAREIDTDQAKATAHAEAVDRLARGLVRHVSNPAPKCLGEGCQRRCLTQSVRSSDRTLFAEAFGLAVESGWIRVGDGGLVTLGEVSD